MSIEISKTDTFLLGIDLPQPFPLGFGTLSHLPRVLYQIEALSESGTITGLGEASIDFPFVNYDAWDIYNILRSLKLEGKTISSREDLLLNQNYRESILKQYPSAFAALNMAIDDLWGKHTNMSLMDIYGKSRNSGRALSSIGFQDDLNKLRIQMMERTKTGYIPKPKVGKSLEEDIKTILSVEIMNLPYVLDFNAFYTPEVFVQLIKTLREKGATFANLIFIEQPTQRSEGIKALSDVRKEIIKLGMNIPIIADESFITISDALECVKASIGLNFKLQKVGGIMYAREIEMAILEKVINSHNNMVGGTFPTAIGRVYDQQGAAILRTTELPGDGWEPASNWFSNNQHLIGEYFIQNSDGTHSPREGVGMGIHPNWEKIRQFIVTDPKSEYQKIRSGEKGDKIDITLRDGIKYADEYAKRSGKDPFWNL